MRTGMVCPKCGIKTDESPYGICGYSFDEEKEVSGSDIINFLQNLGEKEDEALLDVLDFYGDSFYSVLKKTLDESSIEDRKTLLDHLEKNHAKKTQPSS